MARLTTLANLRSMLKAEIGNAQTSGMATAQDTELNGLLSNTQKWLSSEYDWPFLEDRWDVTATPGSRYLSFPTTDTQSTTLAINFERPVKVEVKFNDRWIELDYGISSEQFNYIDSDLSEVLDPIQRWEWSTEGKFEIWPMNSSAQVIRFTGQRALDILTAESDTADLDDMLLVYMAAAELLTRRKMADAPIKQKLATDRLARVRSVYPRRSSVTKLGRQPGSIRRIVPIIAVHGS